jgi:ferredoxin
MQDEVASGQAVLSRTGLDDLVRTLLADGYRVIGPTVRDDAIVLAEVHSADDLPAGWGVDAAPGRYRLRRRADAAVFAHSAGAQSWKQFVHPARRPLWSSDGTDFHPHRAAPKRYAFLGVRACDLAALAVLRGVLGRAADAEAPDPLIIAVGCTEPGGVCFCVSMGSGPAPGPGYDLSLVELIDDHSHRFVVDAGTERGAEVLARIPHRPAPDADTGAARDAVAAAAEAMPRAMPDTDLRTLLIRGRESRQWEDVAQRCLRCGNCTMVCPTCFCTTSEDSTDLVTGVEEHAQRWASCFELDFSYLHGGPVRVSGESRYRQWMTHKLSAWHDQFGTSGCVGCGRCIAWCPAGIDITAEAAALAREQGVGADGGEH